MGNHTILLVDDDPDIRDTVAEALEHGGYQVHRAANGTEAIDLLRAEPAPCIILLDLMMPVMDGYEFRAAQQAFPDWANIPVVIISAGGQAREAATQMGAAACLQKPFSLKTLFSAVERFC